MVSFQYLILRKTHYCWCLLSQRLCSFCYLLLRMPYLVEKMNKIAPYILIVYLISRLSNLTSNMTTSFWGTVMGGFSLVLHISSIYATYSRSIYGPIGSTLLAIVHSLLALYVIVKLGVPLTCLIEPILFLALSLYVNSQFREK